MALDIKQSKRWQYFVTANLRSSKELMKSSMLIEYNFTVSRNENFCVRDPFKSLFFPIYQAHIWYRGVKSDACQIIVDLTTDLLYDLP